MEMAPAFPEEEVVMSLLDRIRQLQEEEQVPQIAVVGPDPKQERERQKKNDAFNELKGKVHLKLLNLLDLSRRGFRPARRTCATA